MGKSKDTELWEKKQVRKYRSGQSEDGMGKREKDPGGSLGNIGPEKSTTPERKVSFLLSVLEVIRFSFPHSGL
jgi:hypothetical protein